jgi:hypothetical protein
MGFRSWRSALSCRRGPTLIMARIVCRMIRRRNRCGADSRRVTASTLCAGTLAIASLSVHAFKWRVTLRLVEFSTLGFACYPCSNHQIGFVCLHARSLLCGLRFKAGSARPTPAPTIRRSLMVAGPIPERLRRTLDFPKRARDPIEGHCAAYRRNHSSRLEKELPEELLRIKQRTGEPTPWNLAGVRARAPRQEHGWTSPENAIATTQSQLH